MRVAIFDYGVGNLHSLTRALEAEGERVRVEIVSDPEAAVAADALVLPGVGAFTHAADRLAPGRDAIRDALGRGLPCLAVCLGMQLLFDRSEEGPGRGLGVLPGRVRRLRARRVPHMGWNALATAPASSPRSRRLPDDPLLADLPAEPVVYFANSFVAQPANESQVLAWTEYAGDRFPALVRRGRTWGAQFHPEKSGAVGRAMIRNFLGLASGAR